MESIIDPKSAVYIGAAIVMGIGSIGPALGQGLIGSKACETIGKNPENAGIIRTTMILAMSLVETVALYCFAIALLMLLWFG